MNEATARTPVLVGVGQVRQRADDPMKAEEPLLLMAAAAERAAEDAGCGDLRRAVQSIRVPRGLWDYANPGAWLGERFGANRPETELAVISGTTVLKLVSEAAAAIQTGRQDVVLVVGGEAEHSKRRAKAAGFTPPRTVQEGPAPDRGLPVMPSFKGHPDADSGLTNPTQCFGLFEVAMRHARGESVEAHRARIASLWARFARVAATNPHAWVQTAPTAEEIASATGGNRIVSSPYHKYMVANMVVDQAAAVFLCSVQKARELGISEERWVFPWVHAEAEVGKAVSHRHSLDEEPVLRRVGQQVLDRARLAADELGPIDLYSCFPAAVQLAMKELGLPDDCTPTQTGGLTFSGGPFNSYVLHAIARTTEALRKDGSRPALVSGVGGFMSRHAMTIFGREPLAGGFERHDLDEEVAALPGRDYAADHQGPVTIESYVVPHDRQGPERAVLAVRTPGGARSWARSRDPELLAALVAEEHCGRQAKVGEDRELRLAG